jgi:hypothetical protein
VIPEIDLTKTRLDFKNLAHKYSVEARVDFRKAEDLAYIAIHEAGHAVGCFLVGFTVEKIYLRPTWGFCVSSFDMPLFLKGMTGDDALNWYMEAVPILCNAGTIANCLAEGFPEHTALSVLDSDLLCHRQFNNLLDDITQARQHLVKLGKRQQEYRLRIKTYTLFRDPQIWAAVYTIAEKLLFKKRLNQKAVMELWQPFAPKHPGYWLDL